MLATGERASEHSNSQVDAWCLVAVARAALRVEASAGAATAGFADIATAAHGSRPATDIDTVRTRVRLHCGEHHGHDDRK